jgi:ATP-binding cassette subfamily F protein uup
MRSTLNLDATLADTISPGSEWVEFAGQRKHVMSYLNDFLFSPERANSPVRTLSGGERNRVLLARLFALPANVLVLDEPTNDLDIDTLELLEELLQAYKGTVFLVSHDRRFLDNVVTSTIVWEGDESPGQWREYEGGYEDWKIQRDRAKLLRDQAARAAGKSKDTPPAPRATAAAPLAAKPRKLSYKEQRELDELPKRIETLEAEQKELAAFLAQPDSYTKEADRAMKAQARHAKIDDELLAAMERWETLGAR